MREADTRGIYDGIISVILSQIKAQLPPMSRPDKSFTCKNALHRNHMRCRALLSYSYIRLRHIKRSARSDLARQNVEIQLLHPSAERLRAERLGVLK